VEILLDAALLFNTIQCQPFHYSCFLSFLLYSDKKPLWVYQQCGQTPSGVSFGSDERVKKRGTAVPRHAMKKTFLLQYSHLCEEKK
jgi:hypothetical protein